MLHRQCDRATVKGNTVQTSGDAGIALFESSDCEVYDNTFEDNGRESFPDSTNLMLLLREIITPGQI